MKLQLGKVRNEMLMTVVLASISAGYLASFTSLSQMI
jgi:hypothetical protein